MRNALVLGLLLSLACASTVGCSTSDAGGAATDSAAPVDDQAEEEVVSGVTKLNGNGSANPPVIRSISNGLYS